MKAERRAAMRRGTVLSPGKNSKARVLALSNLNSTIAAGGPFILARQDGVAWRLSDEAG